LKEVNWLVGWALSYLMKKTRKQLYRSRGPPKKVDEEELLLGRLELLKSIKVFEHAILDNEEYIKDFYCPFHRLLNDGFLALVSPGILTLDYLCCKFLQRLWMRTNEMKW
jgi:hypothetical protein